MHGGKLQGSDAIELRAGRIINSYKVAKDLTITDKPSWTRKREEIASEAALVGPYVIRTSVAALQKDAATRVRNDRSLARGSAFDIVITAQPLHQRALALVHPSRHRQKSASQIQASA